MFSRILIPVDASEPAERAVAMGDYLAAAAGAVVRLVHVSHPCASFISRAPTEKPASEEAAEQLLAKLRDKFSENVRTESEILHGMPAEQIVDLARKWDADLIILGDRDRHILSRFLLGSVADAIVRHAPCSVLVVREKDQPAAGATGPEADKRARG